MSGLEKELGIRLLHRTTRSLALADEGQTFLVHAQALLEERDAALASVRPTTSGATGLLRLTTSAAFGRKVVAPCLVDFMKLQSEVQVDLLLTDSVVDLVAAGLDLAIRIAPLTDSRLIARRLVDIPRGLFAPPSYLASRGSPTLLSDLSGHECLAISGTTKWAFNVGGRLLSPNIGGRFTASTIEGIHQACVGGLGIALLSYLAVAKELKTGELTKINSDHARPQTIAIWAAYPTRRMVPPKVRLFIDHLAGEITSR